MSTATVEDLTLFGLLSRSWELDAGVVDVVFDRSGDAVAFALADGSVALAALADAEPATARIRMSVEHGQASIQPRAKALPPITPVHAGRQAPAAIAPHRESGFVLAEASGALVHVGADGTRDVLSNALDGPITEIDVAPGTGRLACIAAGGEVAVVAAVDDRPAPLPQDGSAQRLGFSPRGDLLAVARDGAVTIWSMEDTPRRVADLPAAERPHAMAWSPDGILLACGHGSGIEAWRMGDGGTISLGDYPSPVRSIVWSAGGAAMVTSGAFRIIAWPRDRLATTGAPPSTLDTGRPSLAAVDAVAAHPSKPLVAAGYENGMLAIAELGKPDELPIKTEGQGAISGLKWSGDGRFLALGTDRGLAAIVELPPQMLK